MTAFKIRNINILRVHTPFKVIASYENAMFAVFSLRLLTMPADHFMHEQPIREDPSQLGPGGNSERENVSSTRPLSA